MVHSVAGGSSRKSRISILQSIKGLRHDQTMLDHEETSGVAQIVAEAHLEYQKFNGFIGDLKRQQWSITYYALTMYGVIIALHKIVLHGHYVHSVETWALSIFAVLTLLLAVLFTYLNIQSLTRARKHLISIRREFFTTKVQENLNLIDPPKSSYEKWWYDWPVLLPLVFVTVIGLTTVLWIVVLTV